MTRTALFAATALSAVALSGAAQAADSLASGQTLRDNANITSPNGQYTLVMQSDCNLVLYDRARRALWASGTHGQGNGCFATMQADGNFVVYDTSTRALWASNTNGRSSGQITVQNDGEVVLTSSGRVVWRTNTAQRDDRGDGRGRDGRGGDGRGGDDRDGRGGDRDGRGGDRGGWGGDRGGGSWGGSGGGSWGGRQDYSSSSRGALKPGSSLHSRNEDTMYSPNGQVRLRMSRDCNLVLETRRATLWESRTANLGRMCSATMERNGELVVYADGRRVWSNRARALGDAGLVVQDDENLVAYEGRRAYWSTDTWRRGR